MRYKHILGIVLAVGGLLGTSGCMAIMSGSTKERATTAAREFNEGIRWGNFNQVARQVTPAKRESFVNRHEGLGEELEFVDYEIVSLTVKPTTPKQKDTEFVVRVHYEWTLRSRGLVEHTDTEQKWKEEGNQFFLQEEVRTKGSPLPCFDEKTPTTTTVAATRAGDTVPTASAQ